MNNFMQIALEEAHAAAARGEVPIGAVLTDSSGTILARNGNRTLEYHDPTAHAEMLVIREACKKTRAQRIPDCDLYVTLEPCTMCAATISFARIRRVIAGAIDPKGGALWHGAKFYDQPTCHHRPEIVHESLEDCGQILKDFFQARRQRTD